MVLFINVNIGQRVEVLLPVGIFKGHVRYKGSVVSKAGEWVGIELDKAVGNHNGCYIGRRYFQCPKDCGVFVSANQVRFIRMKRCLYNRYLRKDSVSKVDNTLFTSIKEEVKENQRKRPKSATNSQDAEDTKSGGFTQSVYYPLRHSISGTMPAKTMLRPQTSQSCYSYRSTPIHDEFWTETDYFNPSPTIPKTHMPHAAQKRLVRLGWGDSRLIRDSTVNTYRETVKSRMWNDVSI